MGDIILTYAVRRGPRRSPRSLRIYFDTGSPRTFIKETPAGQVGGAARLDTPADFGGLGAGSFHASHIIQLQIRMEGLWVPHLCYVVGDRVLDPEYDVLMGHDFMQIYDVHLRPRDRAIDVRRGALKLALRVRSAGASA